MKTLLKEAFEYHHYFNRKLAGEFEKHEGKLPKRTYPLFCHVVNAHQVWNARITGAKPVGVQEVHSLKKCRTMDEENYRNTILILDGYASGNLIAYKNTKGEAYEHTVRDILFHVVNHSTHHKGQIVSDFRQQGIPPLVTDYIFYKRQ